MSDKKSSIANQLRQLFCKPANIFLAAAALLVAVFILFSAANIAVSFFSRKAGCKTVPDIIGLCVEDADEKLERRGMNLIVVGRYLSSDAKIGTVSAQHIAPKSCCAENTYIPVSVNHGVQINVDGTVPDLLYLYAADVGEYISEYDITVETEPCSWAADGLIISQTQSDGAVSITVSSNPEYAYGSQESLSAGADSPSASDFKKSLGTIGLWISRRNITLDIGSQCRLAAKEISFLDALRKTEIVWSSSAPDIASVDSSGNVYALSPGTAVITACTKKGSFEASCQISVVRSITGFELDVPSELTKIAAGNAYSHDGITASIFYSDGTFADVTDKCRFGSVDTSSVGTLQMPVSYSENGTEFSAAVGISVEPVSISVPESFEVGVKCRKNLPIDLNIHGTLAFESSAPDICSVDDAGMLTGITPGSCEITVRCSGEIIAVCQVNVKKTILLTFDDGPNSYTETILDILDEQDVKATFFVIGRPEYSHLYSEIISRGHVLGLHTYSHDFNVCYESSDAFFNDLYRLNALLEQSSVQPVRLFRFPGGTNSNRCYDYITEQILVRAKAEGFIHCDWNAQDCIVLNEDYVIMLMHEKQSDVRQLRQLIKHYKSEGYIFETVSENVELIHFNVAN